MCASVSCHSSQDAPRSTYSHVKWALFSCQGKINLAFPNPGLFRNVVVQFIGSPFVIARLTKSAEAIPVGRAYEGKIELTLLYGGEV